MKTFKLLSLPKPLNYKDLEKIIKSLENESLTAERTESRKNLMNTLNAKENKQLKSTHKKRRGM
jgi:hypothetical protein